MSARLYPLDLVLCTFILLQAFGRGRAVERRAHDCLEDTRRQQRGRRQCQRRRRPLPTNSLYSVGPLEYHAQEPNIPCGDSLTLMSANPEMVAHLNLCEAIDPGMEISVEIS